MPRITNYQPDQSFKIERAFNRADAGRFYHWSRPTMVRVDGKVYEVALNIFERMYQSFLSLFGASYLSRVFQGRTVEPLDRASAKEITDRFDEIANLSRGLLPLALHQAAACDDTYRITELVRLGFDIDRTAKLGRTALHWAAVQNRTDAIRTLVSLGCTINKPELEGQTALHMAAERGHTDVIELLAEHGADLQAKDKDGKTALDLATEQGRTDAISTLTRLENKASAE